jgi:hypothetical protein
MQLRSGNMLSDNALYLLAVSVLAVGVGHRYSTQLNQSSEWAQRALCQVQVVAERASTRIASYVDEGNDRFVDRGDRINGRVQAAIDRAQARASRMQAAVERRNAEVMRVNIAVARANARVACLRLR